MTNYDFDITTTEELFKAISSGVNAADIADEFTARINAAIKRDNDEKALKEAARKKAKEQKEKEILARNAKVKDANALVDIAKDFMKDYYPDLAESYKDMTGESFVSMMDMLSRVKVYFNDAMHEIFVADGMKIGGLKQLLAPFTIDYDFPDTVSELFAQLNANKINL